MKMRIENRLYAALLMTALAGPMLAGRVTAQTFKVVHSFVGPYTGVLGRLVLSGNTLYGTAPEDGTGSYGRVFKVNADGTGFTTLYRFTGGTDEAWPQCKGGLAFSGNTLHGTSVGDNLQDDPINPGTWFSGTVFAVNTDGSGFVTVHRFAPVPWDAQVPGVPGIGTNYEGALPVAAPILSGNTLYGTTTMGGSFGYGTVYAVNTDGSGFTTLYNFTETDDRATSALTLSGNKLYGTTGAGVYAVNTDGSSFTSFQGLVGGSSALILSGNTLYGTTGQGGSFGSGTVFKVNTDFTGFAILHNFGSGDGGCPEGELVLLQDTLYGTASGFCGGQGTVFAVNTDGTGFRVLHTFTVSGPGPEQGPWPRAGLILSGRTLYGATWAGGWGGTTTIFSIELPVTLTIATSGANVSLSWPTNAAGFNLQSTTNLVSQAAWTAVSPAPVIVNALNTVTKPISAAQQFYRLTQ